jgi:hypothetical protein
MANKKTKGGDWQHAESVYGPYPHNAAEGNIITMKGGRRSRYRKGGRGLITDVAVPGSLLLASNYLGRKQTRKHKKRVRFTRRRY